MAFSLMFRFTSSRKVYKVAGTSMNNIWKYIHRFIRYFRHLSSSDEFFVIFQRPSGSIKKRAVPSSVYSIADLSFHSFCFAPDLVCEDNFRNLFTNIDTAISDFACTTRRSWNGSGKKWLATRKLLRDMFMGIPTKILSPELKSFSRRHLRKGPFCVSFFSFFSIFENLTKVLNICSKYSGGKDHPRKCLVGCNRSNAKTYPKKGPVYKRALQMTLNFSFE